MEQTQNNFIEQLETITTKQRTHSQIGKSAKTKGKTGERYFANYLSTITNKQFIRVPNSGAFVGQSNRTRLQHLQHSPQTIHLGDIICPIDIQYHLIFECKNYKNFSFSGLFINNTQINKWLEELLYDVESAYMYIQTNKPIIGFLLCKFTNKGNYIIYNPLLLYTLNPQITFPDIFLHFNYNVPALLAQNYWGNVFHMTKFEDFIKKNMLFVT